MTTVKFLRGKESLYSQHPSWDSPSISSEGVVVWRRPQLNSLTRLILGFRMDFPSVVFFFGLPHPLPQLIGTRRCEYPFVLSACPLAYIRGRIVRGHSGKTTMKTRTDRILSKMAGVSTTLVSGTANNFLPGPESACPRTKRCGRRPDDPGNRSASRLSSRFQLLDGEHARPSGGRM